MPAPITIVEGRFTITVQPAGVRGVVQNVAGAPTVPEPLVTVIVRPVMVAVSAVDGPVAVVTALDSVGAAAAFVETVPTTCACWPQPRSTTPVGLNASVVFTGPSAVPGFTSRFDVIVRPVASVMANTGA